MLIHSKLIALLSYLTHAVSAAPGVQPTPDAGTIFSVYPGWDMVNPGPTTTFGLTELACMQSCSTGAGCVAYAYVPFGFPGTTTGSVCVLKTAIDLTTFQTRAFDVSAGLKGAVGPSRQLDPASASVSLFNPSRRTKIERPENDKSESILTLVPFSPQFWFEKCQPSRTQPTSKSGANTHRERVPYTACFNSFSSRVNEMQPF
ncbi:hypothetical protein B0H13DRAFT_1878423 [Mycena leptocephala]|nr:hypothetical protein B0H13DRAFT_1878423 [Mycena leptocephala]